ncbi:hypothetical protein GCM10008018_09760 [Paenibacillus marchantiophytorum]|uniref:N-acetyltransferase domain-containing protein n=1 Tax=Paenibacillus marchantiophytorum TaxID=1619310 RepID=A0ABQ2BSA0_9BACL|nr:hypothetical protein GCM10008018_09760 [Paenibacillus marchantiophytorum]
MYFTIRQELSEDYSRTEKIVKQAFAEMEHIDKKEHELVSRIRKSNIFIPELSLVATNDEQSAESLALAPISVVPEYQNLGVGKLLMNEALQKAAELGYDSIGIGASRLLSQIWL